MDIQYLLWLQTLRQSSSFPLTEVFTLISHLVYFPLWVLGFIFLYWRVDKRAGLWLLLSAASVELTKVTLKLGFAVPRPFLQHSSLQPANRPTSYSFPSGHSMWSVVEYVGWGLWFALEERAKAVSGKAASVLSKRWPVALGLGLTLLTAFSRNLLGLHTLQDVLAGLALGALLLAGAYKLVNWLWLEESKTETGNREELLLLAGSLLGCLIGYFITHKSYPQGVITRSMASEPEQSIAEAFIAIGLFVGLVWGWYLDRRFIHHTCPPHCGWKESLWGIAGIVGLLVYGLYAYVLLPMFLMQREGMFLVGVTLALWVVVFYPWLLKRFKL